jgi:hypothetical protein
VAVAVNDSDHPGTPVELGTLVTPATPVEVGTLVDVGTLAEPGTLEPAVVPSGVMLKVRRTVSNSSAAFPPVCYAVG